IKIDDSTKLVIMSDCHRGAGDNYDNFLKNKNIYLGALRHYFYHGFTYIELGDGDDMWEVKNYEDIIEENISVFKLIKRFHQNNQFIMIYGNHDIVKRQPKILKDYFYTYFDKNSGEEKELLTDLQVYESLVLDYEGRELFLLHGHQVDFFNSSLWRISRFLVRNIWRKLESIGIKDPTKSAKKYSVSESVEKKLQKWSIDNNKLLIAGHTHRPIMPNIGESLYFNDGSCIHPNGITCLEIENGYISLVKWEYNIDKNRNINIKKTILGSPVSIKLYF
ncbi:MAG: metallophosphoesterase family protein, partial [Bacilli bacterium]|nr:metallophosphoesterase family protein [Bacilli bacterium]